MVRRGSTRPGRVRRVRVRSATRSRLRLVVLQALVLSLFVTLFARLWYIQVLSGDAYQARAAEQSIREVVVQPPRGLIVDDMGRPINSRRIISVIEIIGLGTGIQQTARPAGPVRRHAPAGNLVA